MSRTKTGRGGRIAAGARAALVALCASLLGVMPLVSARENRTVELHGHVLDAETRAGLPARLYVRSADGSWFFAKSASPEGSAVEYRRQHSAGSLEMHTTLSGHPFRAELPPGRYTIVVERGKEYPPAEREVLLENKPVHVEIPLGRWINMAARGWYSGDTHVHRSLDELPNVLLAEDLNVALPLTYWVSRPYTSPVEGNLDKRDAGRRGLIRVDATHVIWPVNTEYEISVGPKSQQLGALFILNHETPLDRGVPPVGPILEQVRREGALVDMDKHSYPWSLMIVPVMKADLFELANNHVWRTEFGIRTWTADTAPEYMKLEIDQGGFTEWGWIDYGFQTYYALLNCGFRLRPTAGTASGVHPVPLGFGRVYVHLADGFDYWAWVRGLDAGRSFVTTGPMLEVTFNGQGPGHTFNDVREERLTMHIAGAAHSAVPLDRIEVVLSGRVLPLPAVDNRPTPQGGYTCPINLDVVLEHSSWIAVRCFENRPDKRVRFAHTAPVHVLVRGRPLGPQRHEVESMIGRIKFELERSRPVLTPAALDEFQQALRVYEKLAERAQ